MLNDNQLKIADFLLKYLDSVGGKSSLDDYPAKLRKQGFDDFDWHTLVKILIEHLGLIDYAGNSDYWIMLTPKGNKAAKIGVEKYFDEIEKEQQLDSKQKQASIDSVKISKRSLIISIVAILISFSFAIINLFENKKEQKIENTQQESNNGNDIANSGNSVHISDSLYIEKVKNSLKHDTVFINEIKDLINKTK